MTAREKAIEAAGLTKDDIATGIAGLWENAWMDPDCRPGPDDVANAVVELIRADIAPHIESALLDRIEAAVRGLRDEETSEPDIGDRGTYGTIYGLDAVLAVLSQIREEGER